MCCFLVWNHKHNIQRHIPICIQLLRFVPLVQLDDSNYQLIPKREISWDSPSRILSASKNMGWNNQTVSSLYHYIIHYGLVYLVYYGWPLYNQSFIWFIIHYSWPFTSMVPKCPSVVSLMSCGWIKIVGRNHGGRRWIKKHTYLYHLFGTIEWALNISWGWDHHQYPLNIIKSTFYSPWPIPIFDGSNMIHLLRRYEKPEVMIQRDPRYSCWIGARWYTSMRNAGVRNESIAAQKPCYSDFYVV